MTINIENVKGIRFQRLGGFSPIQEPGGGQIVQPMIWYFGECLSCNAIILDGETQKHEHANWHNSQTTVAHGTAMLQDQDKQTERLAAELRASRQVLADASLQLKAVRRLCEVLRAGDSSMPSGFLPGAAIADMIEHRLRAEK